MLTKDQLKFHRRGDRVSPVLIDPKDPRVLELARELLDMAATAPGRPLQTVEEETADVAHGAAYAPGLRKLVLDRLEMAPEDAEVEELRWKALAQAEKVRRQGASRGPSELRIEVERKLGIPGEPKIEDRLYADLPGCRPVSGFREISPEGLVHRYNTAQVQGLLLRARKVVVQVKGASLAEKRTLFRQLKFHRLMSEVDPVPGEDRLVLALSGPLALFQNAQTYGMRLANFFPHVLSLTSWTLEAECRVSNRDVVLKLSNRHGLVSHYRQRTGYVPEDLVACLEGFRAQCPGWTLETGSDFVPLGRQSYSFADLTLKGPRGERAFVELFHRWHAGQLEGRLAALEANPSVPLFLGVCRSLAKDDKMRKRLDASPLFAKRGFLFRDLPTVKALEAVTRELPSSS